MYSYPITPEQLQVMWRALTYVVCFERHTDLEDQTVYELQDYFCDTEEDY